MTVKSDGVNLSHNNEKSGTYVRLYLPLFKLLVENRHHHITVRYKQIFCVKINSRNKCTATNPPSVMLSLAFVIVGKTFALILLAVKIKYYSQFALPSLSTIDNVITGMYTSIHQLIRH